MEPIAVIGYAFKLPGGASDDQSLWDIIEKGKNVSQEWPEDRLNLDTFYDQDPHNQNSLKARGGHFLKEDLKAFDAPFFSVTAAEAAAMDPQQRFMLETSYLAFENAGIPLSKVSGSQTGLFEASMADDFNQMLYQDPDTTPRTTATGTARAMLANRVSWYFNLLGPSLHIDTACSGSMVALDLACNSLRNGDSSMTLVAGSNLMLSPVCSLMLSKMNFLSPDSLCYSFDLRANGYSRGEGIIVMVMKRLSDAISAGDTIRAVIRASGTNQDGRTPGITQPSANSQETLIRSVYRKAGLDFAQTRYVEAHGTGTPVGDPIEMQAIGRVFRSSRSAEDPLYVGSVKANIGHLEGGSGLAGVLKSILMLERGVIAPNANFEVMNPDIDSEFFNLQVPTKLIDWPSKGPRRISVNSFGFGGTNAHVVLDDAYHYLKENNIQGNNCTAFSPDTSIAKQKRRVSMFDTGCSGCQLITLSASDEKRLLVTRDLALSYYRQKVTGGSTSLADFAYTLSSRRSDLTWRCHAIIDPSNPCVESDIIMSKPKRSSNQNGAAFVFTGQGAEYARMGLDLMVFPAFRATLERVDDELARLGCKWSVFEKLAGSENINQPQYSQPLCTALQLALVELLASLNVSPVAVVGHSSGEIAASYCAGMISLESACRIAYFRGLLADKLKARSTVKGAMMSVNIPAAEVNTYLQEKFGQAFISNALTIACVNSAKNVTISGEESHINMLKTALDADGIFAMKLSTGIAYHSPAMQAIALQYTAAIGTVTPCAAKKTSIPMISSVTGKAIKARAVQKADYWVQNLLSPVQFESALNGLLDLKNEAKLGMAPSKPVYDLIEVGPHAALRRPCSDTVKNHARSAEVGYEAILVRNTAPIRSVLSLIGTLYSKGYHASVTKANERGRMPVKPRLSLSDMPAYPFDHSQTYWFESRMSHDFRMRGQAPRGVLGDRCSDWNPLQPRWRKVIRTDAMPWILDHVISSNCIYPGTGMLIMALEASKQSATDTRHIEGFFVREALFKNPMVLRENRDGVCSVETICEMRPLRKDYEKHASWSEVVISTCHDGTWTECFRCTIQLQYDESHVDVNGGAEKIHRADMAAKEHENAVARCATSLPSTSFYDYCAARGIVYGPSFSILENINWCQDGTAVGRVPITDGFAAYPGVIHPAVVDAACQVCWLAPSKGLTANMPTNVPHRLQNMHVSASGWNTSQVKICSSARLTEGIKNINGSITILADDGTLLAKVGQLELSAIADDVGTNGLDRKLLHGIDWQPCLSMLSSAEQMQLIVSSIAKTEPAHGMRDYVSELNKVLLRVTSRALSKLEDVDLDALAPHLQKYMMWLKEQHAKMPIVETAEKLPLDSQMENVDNMYPGWAIHMAVARNLVSIIRGETDPLDVIFSTKLAERYYLDIFQRTCYGRLRKVLEMISFENPKMSVLEVGAGTGSFTRHVIDALEDVEMTSGGTRFSEYTYTDVSFSFFEEAKEKFQDIASRTEYKVFDLEKDAFEQGYTENTYDLVLAGAVLHTTEDLQATLRNLRKCMKPGGKILFFENVMRDFALQFSFGTLPGWWRGKENWRAGPYDQCTSDAQWHQLLLDTGFSGNDIVLSEHEDGERGTFSIIVSTAIKLDEVVARPGRLLICADMESKQQNEAAQAIAACSLRQIHQCFCLEEVSTVNIQPQDSVVMLCELDKSILDNLSQSQFEPLQALFQDARQVLWVTESTADLEGGAFAGMATGFLRTMRSEATNSKIVSLALDGSSDGVSQIEAVFKRAFNESHPEDEYRVRNGQVIIGRLREEKALNKNMLNAVYATKISAPWGEGPPLMFNVGTRGTLDTLQFVRDPVPEQAIGDFEVEIDAKAWGLNFRDVFIALGRMDENEFGLDTAGYVRRVGSRCSNIKTGDRVVLARCGSLRMYPRADERTVIKLPDSLSFEDAASLPAPAMTAYHCIVDIARLQRGERILIHSAAGATGQLAVQIAQSIGAEIFATVGSKEKSEFLQSFYGIPADHIFYSRNTSFAQGVLRITGGRGVEVVLNSLAGDGLRASWDCIAPFGRFVEIGKADIKANSGLPMAKFEQNVTYSAVDLRQILIHRINVVQTLMSNMMKLFNEGIVRCPEPRHIYPVSKVEHAFRFLQSGKNHGRIVINNSPEDIVPKVLTTKSSWTFDPNGSYVIAGGLGGIGRATSRWMATKGVKHLILPSRSGAKTQAAKDLVAELSNQGVNVIAPMCDLTSREALSDMLESCQKTMPPIKGCINAAMVLQDAIFSGMTHTQWRTALNAKVQTSWNLHTLLPSGMDFFILLSSLAGVFGNLSQANYAAGNTFQDALADARVAHGEQAVSINLGWMRTIGIISEKEEYQTFRMKGADMAQIEGSEYLSLLDIYCDPQQKCERGSSQVLLGTVTPRDLRAKGIRVPDGMDRPLFSTFSHCPEASVCTESADSMDAGVLFRQSEDSSQREFIAADALAEKLARSLSVPAAEIDRNRPLFEYGVDSLVAVELRNWIVKEFSADVAVFDIMGGATVKGIGGLVAKNSTVGK